MKKKRRKLSDTCALCEAPVWQYDENGKAYCEAHARWKHIEMERVRHPLDSHHTMSVLPHKLKRAGATVVDTVQRLGYAEAFWVAEHLAFESYVQWWDERLIIRLSDLQLVAFAAALRAHREAVYPRRQKRVGKDRDDKDAHKSRRDKKRKDGLL